MRNIRGAALVATFLIPGLLAVGSPVRAASFDCAKANTKIERMICGDVELSKLDEDLAKTYQQALERTSGKQQTTKEQRQWLKEVRNACQDVGCLKVEYQARIQKIGTTAVPESWESVRQLLNLQNKQLQEKQKSAQKVLFFGDDDMPREVDAGYCGQFWQALKDQSSFDIPQPEMLAVSPEQRKVMFDALYVYAKHNYSLYMSQDGKLSPDQYQVGNRSWRLAPGRRMDVPKMFEDAWHRDSDHSGFFGKNTLLDKDITTSFFYLEPFPIPGYVHPLVITLAKDKCDKCTGLSIGLHTVKVDGLPEIRRPYLSYPGLADAKANNRYGWDTYQEPFLLMGIGMFNRKKIFWLLQKQTWDAENPFVLNNDIHYYKSGDFKDYIRDYQVYVYLLSEDPRYGGPSVVCSVQFN